MIILFVCHLLQVVTVSLQKTQEQLKHWSLYDNKTAKYYQVSIPSCTILDLMNHSLIQDFYTNDNHFRLKNLQENDYTYNTSIKLSSLRKNYKRKLIFQGLDTHYKIIINQQQYKSHAPNMFTIHQFDITNLTQKADIKLLFKASRPLDQQKNLNNSIHVDFVYGHTRKAAYQYGWDWAPSAISMGIWKNATIQQYKGRFIDIHIKSTAIDSKFALIKCSIKKQGQGGRIKLNVLGTQKKLNFQKGSNQLNFSVKIKNPKIWWVHTHGDPYLYSFFFQLIDDKQSVLDSKTVKHGIRTIKLNQQNKNFYFQLNGHKIYAKGANYVPPDMFMPRLYNPGFLNKTRFPTLSNLSYQKLIQTMKQSNFNMIRIWGGGHYQTNQFYDLMDKNGIMIFHDFMFSDSMYPDNQQMLDNIREQVNQVVTRLRNHVSIAHWCGNNQIYQGMKAWGFNNKGQRYQKIFMQIIPAQLQLLDDRSYTHSSGVTGIFNINQGDGHFWRVWAGGMDFQVYQSQVGKFNSQFGTQSIPPYYTFQKCISNKSQIFWNSKQIKSHQKHGSPMNLIRYTTTTQTNITEKLLSQQNKFSRLSYLSQISQSYGVGIAIVAQRLKRNHSWGTLYWQFNDAWPVISWSSLDYYGNWKALQYNVKNLYQGIMVGFQVTRQNSKIKAYNVSIVNDFFQDISGSLEMYVVDMKGNQIYSNKTNKFTIKQNEVINQFQVNINARSLTDSFIAFAYFIQQTTGNIYRNTLSNRRSNLNLNDMQGSLIVKLQGQNLVLKTDGLILQLKISRTKQQILLSNNFIDLRKQQTYIVKGIDIKLSQIKQDLVFISYKDQVEGTKLKIQWQ